MKIHCSNCDQRLDISDSLAGSAIECPTCQTNLIVPDLESSIMIEPKSSKSKLISKKIFRSFLVLNLSIIIILFFIISGEDLLNMVLASQSVAGLIAIIIIFLPKSKGTRTHLSWNGLVALAVPLCMLFIGAFISEVFLGNRVGTVWAISGFYVGVIPANLFSFYKLQ